MGGGKSKSETTQKTSREQFSVVDESIREVGDVQGDFLGSNVTSNVGEGGSIFVSQIHKGDEGIPREAWAEAQRGARRLAERLQSGQKKLVQSIAAIAEQQTGASDQIGRLAERFGRPLIWLVGGAIAVWGIVSIFGGRR